MSAMNWTTDKPTQPGWYWYRDNSWRLVAYVSGGGFAYQAYVTETRKVMDEHISKLDGQWAGPLQPPREAR